MMNLPAGTILKVKKEFACYVYHPDAEISLEWKYFKPIDTMFIYNFEYPYYFIRETSDDIFLLFYSYLDLDIFNIMS